MQLTDIAVKALAAPEREQVTYWDATTPGFGVRVSRGGTKSFVLVHGANRRRTTLGRYPAISLKNARDEAKQLLAELTLGKTQRRNMSFAAAKKRFLAETAERVRSSTLEEYTRLLNRHFRFGPLMMHDLTRHEVMRNIEKLKSAPSEQNHAFTVIRIFLNWAVRHEIIDRNPLDGLNKPKPSKSRERYLSEQELKLVYEKARIEPYPYGTIVQLLILMGQRRGETSHLRWDWINSEERLITFPASVTKNKREHVIPYGDLVATVFDSTPVVGDFLFASRSEKGTVFRGWSKCKRRFDVGLEVAPFTLHDLRRTYSSTHAMLGTPIHVTEKLLNHVSGTVSGVAAIYNRHSYIQEMRSAVDRYEEYLSGAL